MRLHLKEDFFDIQDDDIFQKEDLIDFAESIVDKLGKMFNRVFNLTDINMKSKASKHTLHIELTDSKTGEVFSITKDLDGRSVKFARDLYKKYLQYFIEYFSEQIKAIDLMYNESFNKDDFKYFDKKQLTKMIKGADNYKGLDKKSAVKAMKSALKDLDESKMSNFLDDSTIDHIGYSLDNIDIYVNDTFNWLEKDWSRQNIKNLVNNVKSELSNIENLVGI